MQRRDPSSPLAPLTRLALLRRLLLAAGALVVAARAPVPAFAAGDDLGDGVRATPLRLQAGRRLLDRKAPRPFVRRLELDAPAALVGVRWDGRRTPVELRARRRDGSWTAWWPLAPGEHASDDAGQPVVSEPIWVDAADVVEVRAAAPVTGLAAVTVSRADPPAVRALQSDAPLPVAPNGVRPPAIVRRSEWTGGKMKPKEPPELGEILAAIVHHTASGDDYGPEDSAAIVFAICRFHRRVNKWSDIGYHLLVDRYGQVFEGRAGGLDRPLVGAHAFGANRTTAGIAMIGTWSNALPESDGLSALARTVAWKLSLHGCPVDGTVTLTDADGAEHEIDRICGHRDWNATRCPGRALEDALPDLRARAAAIVVPPPRIELAASAEQVAVGTVVAFDGRLTDAGAPAPWKRLALVRSAPKPAKGLGFVTTDGDGRFHHELALTDGGTFEMRLPDGRAVSDGVQVLVRPRIRLAIRRRPADGGPGLHVRGWVKPHVRSVILDVHRRRADGGWRRIARWRVRLANGGLDVQVPVPSSGRYRVRVSAAQDGRLVATAPAQALVHIRG